MGWIEHSRKKAQEEVEAVKQERLEAERKQKAFEAEEVTEEKAIAFMHPYVRIMDSIIEDLVAYQFSVVDSGYDYSYVHHERADQCTLWGIISNGESEVETLETGIQLISNLDICVAFGRQWEIIHPDGTSLGMISMRPMISDETHFAEISLTFCDTIRTADEASLAQAVNSLQIGIGRWIENHDKKMLSEE